LAQGYHAGSRWIDKPFFGTARERLTVFEPRSSADIPMPRGCRLWRRRPLSHPVHAPSFDVRQCGVVTVPETTMHRPIALTRLLQVAVVALASALNTVGRAETVYVVSQSGNQLFRFDTANPYGTVASVPLSSALNAPSGLALGSDGNLYIGDIAPDYSAGRISRYTIATGSLAPVVTLSGTTFTAGPIAPAAIAFRPASQGGEMLVGRSPISNLYFSFPDDGPVVKVTGWDGSGPVQVADYTGGPGGGLASSPGLAVAPDGTLYVSNSTYPSSTLTGTIASFASAGATGTFAGNVALQGAGANLPADAGLSGPTGLLLGGSTSLYSASVMNGRIYRTDLATNTTTAFGGLLLDGVGLGSPATLARLTGGDLIVGDSAGAGLLWRISADGNTTSVFFDPTAPANTSGIDFGAIGGIAVVPEPSAVVLAAIGGAGLGWRFRPRRRRKGG
jgi:sugar lactone lactonase YvrE